jgi:hypothetical protein
MVKLKSPKSSLFFCQIELVNIGRAIETDIMGAAKDRQSEGSGNLPEPGKGQSRDKIAKLHGTSGKTLKKPRP